LGEHRDIIGVLLHWVQVARGGAPHIHLLLLEEAAIHQRQQIFGLHFGFLPLLVRIRARGRCRRC
jgi:hypothetical protein